MKTPKQQPGNFAGHQDGFIQSFRQIQPRFSRLHARILACLDLTFPQFALLNLLADSAPMTMTEASEKLYLTKAAITNLVDKLERKKCLKRISHSGDRRIYLLEIQPRGVEIVQKIRAQILKYLLKTLSAFSEPEKKIIARFYAALSPVLEKALDCQGKK